MNHRTIVLSLSRFNFAALAAGLVSLATLWSAPARAEEQADLVATATVRTAGANASGTFLALTMAPSLADRRASVVSFGGYDSGDKMGQFEAFGEVIVWQRLALRVGAMRTDGNRRMRPSVGARVQLLEESRYGVDGTIGVFYRPEGFTEPEGEIETIVGFGKHLGRTYVLGNLVYGQDPEGRERDGEVRLAALHPLGTRFLAGLDGRLRFDLGSDASLRAQKGEPTADLLVGPAAAASLGPVALGLQSGVSSVKYAGQARWGVFVLAGVGAAF